MRYIYHPKNRDELKAIVYELIEKRGNNTNLNDIDVSNLKSMYSMFQESQFNGDISKWDVSNVEDMNDMFYDPPLEGKEPQWYKEWLETK